MTTATRPETLDEVIDRLSARHAWVLQDMYEHYKDFAEENEERFKEFLIERSREDFVWEVFDELDMNLNIRPAPEHREEIETAILAQYDEGYAIGEAAEEIADQFYWTDPQEPEEDGE